MSTTSTDPTTHEGGLPLPEPQAVDGPIFKQVWQTQTDALETTEAHPHAATSGEETPASDDDSGGTHSA